MKLNEPKRMRAFQMRMTGGEMVEGPAGDIMLDENGLVHVTGIWEGIVPFSAEEVDMQAVREGVSSMEWMKRRLLLSSLVRVETIE